jgi:hypothetical protein
MRGRNFKFCGPKITAGLERQPTESRQLVDFNQRFTHAAVGAGNLDCVATSTQARGGRLTSVTQKVSARSSAAPTGSLDQMPRNAAKYIIGAGGRSVALLHCDGVGSFAAARCAAVGAIMGHPGDGQLAPPLPPEHPTKILPRRELVVSEFRTPVRLSPRLTRDASIAPSKILGVPVSYHRPLTPSSAFG